MRMKFPSEEAAEVVFNKLMPMEINGKTFEYEPTTEGELFLVLVVVFVSMHLTYLDSSNIFAYSLCHSWNPGAVEIHGTMCIKGLACLIRLITIIGGHHY